MNKDPNIKRLQRRAKALLLRKEIPPSRMEIVRTLLQAEKNDPLECYTAIIDLVKDCPDKKLDGQGNYMEVSDGLKNNPDDSGNATGVITNAPTETHYYIDSLQKQYKPLKIFKKRYMVHRNNRFGIGLRKRLIPNNRFLKILRYIGTYQDYIASHLPNILLMILQDKEIENPTSFNYIRLFRKWILEIPLKNSGYEAVKWMERPQFDREFKAFICGFFAFLRLDTETREAIIYQVEQKLRLLDDFRKRELKEKDSEPQKREKEKHNLLCEKKVFEYMSFLRSFLPHDPKEENLLSSNLRIKYKIDNLTQFLLMVTEVLIFQRPFKRKELLTYYGISTPVVSTTIWDYNEEQLKRFGKDPEAKQKQEIDSLKDELAEYDTLERMLKYDEKGRNILMEALHDQWLLIDHKDQNPRDMFNDNIILYLDGLLHCFNNSYVPILDGSQLIFRDVVKEELFGSIFTAYIFQNELATLRAIMNDLFYVKKNNPFIAIQRTNLLAFMNEETDNPVMENIKNIIQTAGDMFYSIGKKLHRLYDYHKKWVFNGKNLPDNSIIRSSIEDIDIDSDRFAQGKPIPFYDCTVKKFKNETVLSNILLGKALITDDLKQGEIVKLLAFCYQAAYINYNGLILSDIKRMKELKKSISEMSKKQQ